MFLIILFVSLSQMQGGSGAQSCSIQVFDALLGVEHLPGQR